MLNVTRPHRHINNNSLSFQLTTMYDPSLALPPLPALSLPPLPRIADAVLARNCVTHSSVNSRHKPNLSLDLTTPTADDYEKLEHVGDSLLCTITVTLLQDMYPDLPPGPSTVSWRGSVDADQKLKDHLVNNKTLSQLCIRYGIMDGFIAAPSALYTAKQQYKVQAAVFEAYIAAVFFDFLTSETPGGYGTDCNSTTTNYSTVTDYSSAAQSLLSSPSPPTAAAMEAAYRAAMAPVPLPPLSSLPRERGDALTYVETWLRPLLAPVADFALRYLYQAEKDMQAHAADKAADDPNTDKVCTGAMGALNGWLSHHHGTLPEYTAEAVDASWRGVCTAKVGETVFTGEAVRPTKKGAWTVAAWKVCTQAGVPL